MKRRQGRRLTTPLPPPLPIDRRALDQLCLFVYHLLQICGFFFFGFLFQTFIINFFFLESMVVPHFFSPSTSDKTHSLAYI